MRILIKVTKEILEQSAYCGINPKTGEFLGAYQANIGQNCAISKAISELFDTAWVERKIINIFVHKPFFGHREEPLFVIALPEKASKFIKDFDCSAPNKRLNMQPISFEIDIPDSVIESIGISEAERIISNSLTMEKV